MNNVVMRKVTVTAGYQALVATKLVASVTVSCPPTNVGVVNFLADDGTDVPWRPGEWHDLQHVDISQIRVKGTNGDLVTIVGGTW